ncbi:MAG: hypothetical protein AAGF98_03680 [Cyanobacteria bacterium P01_H01_bin.153]
MSHQSRPALTADASSSDGGWHWQTSMGVKVAGYPLSWWPDCGLVSQHADREQMTEGDRERLSG